MASPNQYDDTRLSPSSMLTDAKHRTRRPFGSLGAGVLGVLGLVLVVLNIVLYVSCGEFSRGCSDQLVNTAVLGFDDFSGSNNLPMPSLPSHEFCRHALCAVALPDPGKSLSLALLVATMYLVFPMNWAQYCIRPTIPPPQPLAA